MALVALSVVEQRLDAVRAVLAGASVSEVVAQVGVSRQSIHAWVGRYLSEGVTGLADRSSRPRSCPYQAPERVERAVLELRREHPRWGAKRIRLELLRRGLPWQPDARLAPAQLPSTSTINRILRPGYHRPLRQRFTVCGYSDRSSRRCASLLAHAAQAL